MTKRFRDENGILTMRLSQVMEETKDEVAKYYQVGGIYLYAKDLEEYVLTEVNDGLALFHSFSDKKIFIPTDSLGTFLPDVASVGSELIRVE